MRQNQDVTRQNLAAILKTIHASDILGGQWAIRDYALNTFHGGQDPNGKNENPIFKEAAEQFAYYEHSASDFEHLLADYTKLLAMFSVYLSNEGMIAEQAEIIRIQSGLAVQAVRPAPAQRARWRDTIAVVVAILGACLLEYACGGKDLYRHLAGLLGLLVVAAAVWNLATRRATLRVLALITQPTR